MSGTFQGRIAFANITFPGGTPTIASQSGDFDSIATGGAGVLDFTLKNEIDPDEAIYICTARTATDAAVSVSAATDSTIQLRIWDIAGAALADLPCNIAILVKPVQ